MILIFSNANDFSTTSVVKYLRDNKQKVLVINSDDDVNKLVKINKNGIYFRNTITKELNNLLDTKSCWWRRTGLGLKNFLQSEPKKELVVNNINITEIISGSRGLIKSEVEELRGYIFEKVYNTCKINIGSPKLYDLNRLITIDKAKELGFKVPPYEIITNLNQINEASTIDNKFVSKSIANGIYHQIKNHAFYSYTELHNKSDYLNQDLNVFPSLITGLVDKKLEIRAFYLDGHFYSMAIFSQTNDQTKVDFRKYSDVKPNKIEPYKLPSEIEIKLKSIFDEVGLNCGSSDLILDADNEFVFLEINPVGQYAMTSEPCNYNLDKIIAKYLIDGRVSN